MKLIIQSIKNYLKSKKDRGLEPVFFEKIGDQKTSRDQMRKNLIKALEWLDNKEITYNLPGNQVENIGNSIISIP